MAGAPPGVPSCPPSAHSSSLLACLAGRARAGLDPFQWGWVRPHSMLSTRSKFHNPPRCFQPDKGRSSTAYCESCLSRLLLFATQHGGIDFLVSSRGFQTFFSSSSKRLPSWIPDTAVRGSRCHSRLAWPLSLRSPRSGDRRRSVKASASGASGWSVRVVRRGAVGSPLLRRSGGTGTRRMVQYRSGVSSVRPRSLLPRPCVRMKTD